MSGKKEEKVCPLAPTLSYDHEGFNKFDVLALTEQFGLVFYRSEDSLLDWDHNLRTILIDQEGIIREILIGNQWKGEKLAEKITRLIGAEEVPSESTH